LFSDESVQPEAHEENLETPAKEMQDGELLARTKGLEVVGSFHSRVNRPARPSSQNRQNGRPNSTVVMVGVQDGRAHELTAWTLSEDRSAYYQEDFRTSPKS
jgi:proteasome lid subunit RPN8/RPN11